MEEEGKCEVCGKPASQKCGGCHAVFYCSREHQKAAWKKHKKVCRPFKVSRDAAVGRHPTATRDVPAGAVVAREPPLVWGPAQTTPPVCLGCGRGLAAASARPCPRCGWPVCGETCARAPAHLPECRYTAQRGEKVSINNFGVNHPTYQCITVLRCLYQKQFLPEVWKKIDSLESHCEDRRNTARYEHDRTYIARFILRFFKLENVFTEEEIMRVCGIVMINAHEVPLTDPPHVAIYESCSMFEHSCAANCSKTFTAAGEVLLVTGRRVRKGEHLTICYADPLWGTANRRHYLRESKYFWCACARCADVTEFGTYFSAIRCTESECKGYMLPKTFLENTNNEKGCDWYCDKCKTSKSSYAVYDLLERIGRDLSEIEKGVSSACKDFIKTYEQHLHPNHYYLTDVKFQLTQIIGQEHGGGLPAVSDEDLKLKAQYCRSLDSLAQIIMPGERRMRGVVLFELHAAITELGRREATVQANPEILHKSLLEAKKVLEEAADLLRFEPEVLPEGKLYKHALANLKDIDSVMRTVHLAIGDSPV